MGDPKVNRVKTVPPAVPFPETLSCGTGRGNAAAAVSSAAVRSMLFEVSASPKPGLVDRFSSGAHGDMDYFTFLASITAISPYLQRMADYPRRFLEELEDQKFPSDPSSLQLCHEKLPAVDPVCTECIPAKYIPKEYISVKSSQDKSSQHKEVFNYAALFPGLRSIGREAEDAMFRATGGVNTHKGLIFSLGVLCAAASAIFHQGGSLLDSGLAEAAAAAAGRISEGIVQRDLGGLGLDSFRKKAVPNNFHRDTRVEAAVGLRVKSGKSAELRKLTAGEKLYLQYGVRGIRGEAEDGFPTVLRYGLPRLRKYLGKYSLNAHKPLSKDGRKSAMAESGVEMGNIGLQSLNMVYLDVFMELLCHTEDSNVLSRGGWDALQWIQGEARSIMTLGGAETPEGMAGIRKLDAACMRRNISPGGTADLLAVTIFLSQLDTLDALDSSDSDWNTRDSDLISANTRGGPF
ncbi:MAG: triphosphoribosyl-dephospho-CoA synthase [Spirochaetales bacterium]|nr:triphosphoribosyl-dephospho-CoA synthase [Spirochaetales bacterium]